MTVEPPPFATALARRGEQVAVVPPAGAPVSYRDLSDRVAATRARLGSERRLVLVAATNDLAPLVTYLAALQAGHPVLLAPGGDDVALAALVAAYDPDVVAADDGGGWQLVERRRGTAHVLHPELALLLSTSGSTGSPKLVRLSAAGLAANAAAIADHLDIRPGDRAAANLPMHYCYGLSVINSNLHRGAAVLLPGGSVTDARFWSAFREHGGTSLHGVPYTFELLDRVGFPEMHLPGLRYVTQAGGRLAPETVRRYAGLGAARGWRLHVMYGQTEATARMAVLPPDLAATHPSAIGLPITGGTFHIDRPDGTGEGELVYTGPNVMLGYATGPADLALGRTVERLHTGDLARRRPDGLYEVTGRRNRFVKPFGLRIDLDRVESMLAEQGCTAAATGTDDEITVLVANGADLDAVRRFLASRLGLPVAAVQVAAGEIPRRPNGKIDHQAIARRASARCDVRPVRRPRSVHDAFRAVFPIQDLPGDATFVDLGGDSLSYVRMTVELERVLGHLPEGWDRTPIHTLARIPRRRAPRWTRTETPVVLRAVAILLVVGSHVGLFHLLGGSHVLLATAGWVFARFVLSDRTPGSTPRWILRAAARIAVPSLLWITWRAASQDDLHLGNVLMVNQFLDPGAWGYWYVETLTQILLLFALVFAIPAVTRLERAHPFRFALAVLLVALLGLLHPDRGNEFSDRLMSAHLVLWLFVLGWVAHRATTTGQRGLTAILVLLLVPAFFAEEPLRGAVVTAGLLLLLLPRVAVPRWSLRPISAVATASLAVYLTHYAVYPPLLPHLPRAAILLVCVLAGIVAHRVATTAARGGAGVLARLARRTAGPALPTRVDVLPVLPVAGTGPGQPIAGASAAHP